MMEYYKNRMYKASVIINTLNDREDWLREAVDSYLQQENVEIQLIVSTIEDDSSLSVLKDYPNIDFCVTKKYEHSQSKSPRYYQLNNAMKLAKHPWWCFAAGDDVALPNKIFKEISMCLEHDSNICSSAIYKTDEQLNITSTTQMPEKYLGLSKHLAGNFVADCSLINIDLWREFGPFDTSLEQMAHWDFWLRVFSVYDENLIVFNSEPTWLYRIHDKCVHQRDRKSKQRAQHREASRKRMMQKHYHLLENYNVEHLATQDIYK